MLTMVKTYTYAGGRQAWAVKTQLERCAVSLDSDNQNNKLMWQAAREEIPI